jgi:hypothetical protein
MHALLVSLRVPVAGGSISQWEALVLLILGITVNQLACVPASESALGGISWIAYLYTLMSVRGLL